MNRNKYIDGVKSSRSYTPEIGDRVKLSHLYFAANLNLLSQPVRHDFYRGLRGVVVGDFNDDFTIKWDAPAGNAFTQKTFVHEHITHE